MGYNLKVKNLIYIKVGDKIKPIKIDWKYKTLLKTLESTQKKIENKNIQKIYGFSFGGYLVSLLNTKAKKIILSPTPLYKRFVDKMPKKEKKYMGKKRYEEAKNTSIPTIKASVFVGENEPELAKETAKALGKTKIVKGYGHSQILFNKLIYGKL